VDPLWTFVLGAVDTGGLILILFLLYGMRKKLGGGSDGRDS
jgi:hypothetical protein